MSELHRSAKGKIVDMTKLASQNELAVAVSNVKINARGDELGPGGKIIRTTSVQEVAPTGIPVERYAPKASQEPIATPKPKSTFKPVPELQTSLITVSENNKPKGKQ